MIDINIMLPEPKQPITAIIEYQGKEQRVHGCRSENEERVVIFDFYSGCAGGTIIEWEPRELPNKPDAHPWTGIENKGI